MCRFIETIKLEDGEFYYLGYHQERVNKTFRRFFPDEQPFDLEKALKSTKKPECGFFRCRVIYGYNIQTIEFIEQEVREIETLQIVHCNSIDYSYKYFDRELIQELTKQKKDKDDILIVKNNLVTDTSVGNILFFDGKKWITPDTPLLPGTTRERLLQKGEIKEAKVMLPDITKYTAFQVVNALISFKVGRFISTGNIHY